MTIYRIKSAVLRDKREKYETFDERRAAKRLVEVKTIDPQATLLRIPVKR